MQFSDKFAQINGRSERNWKARPDWNTTDSGEDYKLQWSDNHGTFALMQTCGQNTEKDKWNIWGAFPPLNKYITITDLWVRGFTLSVYRARHMMREHARAWSRVRRMWAPHHEIRIYFRFQSWHACPLRFVILFHVSARDSATGHVIFRAPSVVGPTWRTGSEWGAATWLKDVLRRVRTQKGREVGRGLRALLTVKKDEERYFRTTHWLEIWSLRISTGDREWDHCGGRVGPKVPGDGRGSGSYS